MKMDAYKFVEKLVKKLDECEAAHDLPCSCSGLTIQIQGCSCERAKVIKKVEKRMNRLLNKGRKVK